MSTDLGRASDSELEAEIARRKTPRPPDRAPAPLANPDFAPLIELIVEGVAQSIADGCENDDLYHYAYEAALTAVYGKEYWQWRNKQTW